MQHLRRRPQSRWYWLLVLPFFAVIWPALYAKSEPAIWGIPFFYWYQFIWIALSGALAGLVYLLARHSTRP